MYFVGDEILSDNNVTQVHFKWFLMLLSAKKSSPK